ncbi:hypothetical protein BASA60_002329 [Batrachochytrium salamandrivorans]|nr:hypothetical protein BASA62_005720 [Batrachochytrium salamandrivorans]KAH6581667.1 hypothetical protein BASA60_002329 [Batrachochytrium salamandrivorans]
MPCIIRDGALHTPTTARPSPSSMAYACPNHLIKSASAHHLHQVTHRESHQHLQSVMIYTSYAGLAMIAALLSASTATPAAQDQTSVYLEKRSPPESVKSPNSPQSLRQPKVDRPLPKWVRPSTYRSQVGTSQAARPVSRLIRQPTYRSQVGTSQAAQPMPKLVKQYTYRNQDSTSQAARPMPKLVKQHIYRNQDSTSQESQPPLESVKSPNSPQSLRQPKVDRPLPKWVRPSTYRSQVGTSQAARPVSRLIRQPTYRSQVGTSQAARPMPKLVKQHTYQNQDSISQESQPMPKLVKQHTYQNQDSISQESQPMPKLVKQHTYQNQDSISQESQPMPKLVKQHTYQNQDSISQESQPPPESVKQHIYQNQDGISQEPPLASNSDFDMQNEQDPTNSHASQGGIKGVKMSSPGSSTGRSHGTLPKGATLRSQSKIYCRLSNALKIRFLVSKEELERALADSSTEIDATGRLQVPRAKPKQLYLTRIGTLSLVETPGCRKNPTSDKAYLKLLSTLSKAERD